MELGIDSFVWQRGHPADRVAELLEEIELADRVGIDAFGLGEHHRIEYLSSAPVVLLAAAAARTQRIRLGSAVTVLSSDDPVRVFQQFATLDLISRGRAEIIVGRGSFIESYPLFGFDLGDYDELFVEKLELLLKLRERVTVEWSGHHRAPLTGQAVYPRPVQAELPIYIGVGGTPQSFARAGTLGLPLMVAIIGGEPRRFRPLVDLYRESWQRAGHPPENLRVGVHSIGFLADTTEEAARIFYPGYENVFTRIGRERGWPPMTRGQFEAAMGPRGALLIGEPASVAEKILAVNEALGGIDRMAVQLGAADVPHAAMMRATELLGTRVGPMVRAARVAPTLGATP
jgi:probable LLM family oxidoreductase